MTTDGLRMVFGGLQLGGSGQAVFYADRGSLDARFGTASVLDGVPATVTDAYLSEDCERIYFSGLQSIFYEQRAQDGR